MKIGSINSIINNPLINDPVNKTKSPKFNNILTNFIGEVNKSSMDADKLVTDFINGKDVQLHEVMIAGEKAKTNLELLMEIRNKAVDMYKELTRMQT
ncbi:flagellar hook-basal body protein FliE [bacterium BMS3Abin03]|nr:flagellar hook-basal body protein FliE [bacterium BMS3Abin03]